MSFSAPYLSIVLVARNDNYSGDFNERLHNSVHWLTCLVERNKLPAELIIVDYNPVSGNEPISAMLDWPENRNYLAIRFLHVPNGTHEGLVNPRVRKTVPVFEFNAKNMAIRRAKGEYILSTNADILLHPSIIGFIANKMPDKNCYYRAFRFDYNKISFYDFNNPYATLRRIQRNVFRLLLRGYDYRVIWGENFIEEKISKFRNSFQLFLNFNLVKVKSLANLLQMKVNHDSLVLKYHTNASGDFMLMHRDNWFSLRGYPEDTYISTHCDAIFTVMSKVAGIKENILRWPIYHQHHERRYNTDIIESKFNNNKDISDMFRRFVNDTREMEATCQPKIVNPPDWGAASKNFAETVI